MELTRSLVETKAREYRTEEPLYTIEQEHVEMLPETFRSGTYGWRDIEWVVQWYFRRYLGAYPDDERRAAEASFRENDFEEVVRVMETVVEQDPRVGLVSRLTTLDGVDVPVATAFLMFAFPDQFVVLGDREWRTLQMADELDRSYPAVPTVGDYRTYQEVCHDIADRCEVTAWTLYRALWRLGRER